MIFWKIFTFFYLSRIFPPKINFELIIPKPAFKVIIQCSTVIFFIAHRENPAFKKKLFHRNLQTTNLKPDNWYYYPNG